MLGIEMDPEVMEVEVSKPSPYCLSSIERVADVSPLHKMALLLKVHPILLHVT